MYKKVLSTLFILTILTLLFINSYIQLEYDINLFEYLSFNTALTDEEIAYLNEHNTLIYGADYNSPPLRYVNSYSGQYEGLSVDYLNALSLELGITIEYEPLLWNDALIQLSEGKTDICDMYMSEERSEMFLFSNPIYYQRGVILVDKSNTSIQNLDDLEGKTLAGNKGDYVFEYLDKNYEDVTPIETADLQEAIDLLKNGEVDAVLGDESVINYFITQDNIVNDYVILDTHLYEREAVIAVSKDNEELLNILNKGITRLNKENTMQKIYQKWFGVSPLITKDNNYEKYELFSKYAVLLGLIIAFLLYSWNIQLKKEVKKRTNELYLSNNELETIFNGVTHLMVVVNEECMVTEANATFCNKINYTKENVKNVHCHKVNGILGTDCNNCIIKDTFVNNRPIIRQVRHTNRIFKASTFILEQLPETSRRVLIMMEDITDMKVNEQRMLQSSKMAAVGQLAAGIAHEIRNPLGIIRNYCYLLKMTIKDDGEKESVSIIESSVERANKIIDNLLNFSSLTDNTKVNTNIYALINDIFDLNKKSLKTKKINCSLECEKDLHLMINSESLKHILINLITNAVDAMKNGGNLNISVYDNHDDLVIQVTDTGSGMDDDTLINIFNPFFTTKEPGSGTGLGLYITYNEVQKMDGTLKVDSTVDIGTTFTISLPIDEENSIQGGNYGLKQL